MCVNTLDSLVCQGQAGASATRITSLSAGQADHKSPVTPFSTRNWCSSRKRCNLLKTKSDTRRYPELETGALPTASASIVVILRAVFWPEESLFFFSLL